MISRWRRPNQCCRFALGSLGFRQIAPYVHFCSREARRSRRRLHQARKLALLRSDRQHLKGGVTVALDDGVVLGSVVPGAAPVPGVVLEVE